MQRVRATREAVRPEAALEALARSAEGTDNTMAAMVECARAYVTVGEVSAVLRRVWGEYTELPSF